MTSIDQQNYKDMKRVKSKQFRVTTLSIGTFYSSFIDGTYDLNPPHQRNIVHDNEWKSNIIHSNIQGLPIGHPEFDTIRNSKGLRVHRSLDGKQRCCAFINYVENKFAYKPSGDKFPTAMYGKFFKDIPEEWQKIVKNGELAINITDSTFSKKELSEHFRNKQQTKQTLLGEKLNACYATDVIRFANKIIKKEKPLFEKIKPNDNRFSTLELVTRVIYALNILENRKIEIHPQRAKIDTVNPNDILEWVENFQDKNLDRFQDIICRLFSIILNSSSKYKNSKSFVLPLVNIMYKYSSWDSIEVFVITYVDRLDNFYNDKNVHNSDKKNMRRIIILEEEFLKFCQEKNLILNINTGNESGDESESGDGSEI